MTEYPNIKTYREDQLPIIDIYLEFIYFVIGYWILGIDY